MKKSEREANEALKFEMRHRAETVMLHAIQECEAMGVKVYADECPGYGDPGVHKHLSSSYDLDFEVDLRRAKLYKASASKPI